MKKKLKRIAIAATLVIATGSAAQAAAVSLTTAGYTQNFDSMGTGTTFLTGWSAINLTYGADSHAQWTTSIPGSQLTGTAITTITAMTDTSIVNGTKSGSAIYNMADATVGTSNRALATSPTGDNGVGLQLSMTNTGTTAITTLNISYDIKKYTDGALQSSFDSTLPHNEELPGYQLFYSVNGGAYTNVAAFNPITTTDGVHPVIPVGTVAANGAKPNLDYTVTNVSGTITLATAVAAGQTLNFMWVDDNAVNISPDQVIGLDDVNITPTPIPAAAWLLGSGLMGLAGFRRKGKKQ